LPEHEDESPEFWLTKSKQELADVAAVLHRDRRKLAESFGYNEVMTFRRAIATIFLQGNGLEVGAGNRPWPVPPDAKCYYGDLLDRVNLKQYFKDCDPSYDVYLDGFVDAQTFKGVPSGSLDFVISAHVIEHLADPIGAIREAIRVLKSGGIHLLAVPDMRLTHDRNRPATTLEHLLSDELDGGAGTRRQAYEEHCRYVHTIYHPQIPEAQFDLDVTRINENNMDIHWHAWTGETFRALLDAVADRHSFQTIAHVPVQNENIFVLRKR
jgi:SAM-dependent methyltransferase